MNASDIDHSMVPVTILTGFLGSGKTTLLNRLLRLPALAGAAVIVNEFGEIGLDHLLIEASEEQFTLLDNGCVCCTVRGDLVETLKHLDQRSRTGAMERLTRVVIETTGLADPAPIMHTLMAEPELADRFRVGGIVTTVDAVNGLATLDRHPEAAKQAAVADRLLVTKTDLAQARNIALLEERLAAIAPTAIRSVALNGNTDFDLMETADFDTAAGPDKLIRWFESATATDDLGHGGEPGCDHHHGHGHHPHHGIRSYSFVIDRPVEWGAFARWLDYLAAMKGEDLLRFKGLVHVAEDPVRPLVVHGVQHVFHPPARLAAWPTSDRSTRLVFIVRDIKRETIERTLVKFAGIDPAAIDSPVRTAA